MVVAVAGLDKDGAVAQALRIDLGVRVVEVDAWIKQRKEKFYFWQGCGSRKTKSSVKFYTNANL